jgi:spermidine/putrescine-binding protein
MKLSSVRPWAALARVLTVAALTLAGAALAQPREEPVLHVYNWSNYIGPDTIAQFERETGIRVRYDTFDNNEIVHAKLIAGRTGHNIQALIPRTGGLLFFDVMVIPADAPRPGNAHKFINFILRPDVNAGLVNTVFYANPVPAARQFIRPEVANNPTVFLSPADMARMIPPQPINNDIRRLMTRTFTSFKTGL